MRTPLLTRQTRKASTVDLAEKALQVLADTDAPLYSEQLTAALQKMTTNLVAAHRTRGPAPGMDLLRDVALAILTDRDNATAQARTA